MCDSRRPLNGADSDESLHDSPSEPPSRPVWPSRAVNGGWDSPRATSDTPMPAEAQDAAESLTGAFLRLVA